MNNFKTNAEMAKPNPREMAPRGGGNFSNEPPSPKLPKKSERQRAFELMGLAYELGKEIGGRR